VSREVEHPCVRDAVLVARVEGPWVASLRLRTDRSLWAGEAPVWWPCWAVRRVHGVIPLSGERWHALMSRYHDMRPS